MSDPDAAAVAAIRSQATEVARGWSAPDAPPSWALTAAIFRTLAADDDLLALAARIPPDRLPALLLAAAACYLVGRDQPPGLAGWFPKPGQDERPPPVDASFERLWRSFCLDHGDELLEVCHRRRYQMNEVARSTQVALALGVVAARTGAEPVALIDLGTGAGLGLHLDRYRHQLSDGRWLGDATSPVVLECRIGADATASGVEGPLLPPPADRPGGVPTGLPDIGWRIGVDLDPPDLADAEDLRWLRACVPPETGALRRFDGAVEMALAHPCPIRRGDAVTLLPEILDAVPADLLPVVVDTYAAVFFTAEERAALRQLVVAAGAGRPLVWVSLDPLVPLGTAGRDSVQGLDVPGDLVRRYQEEGVFAVLGLLWSGPGPGPHDRVLARAHPSGTSVTWLDLGRP